MSSSKRLIARLDIKGKRLIKGIRFEGLRVIGDACEAAGKYAAKGVDEIFYTDAVASLYGRNGLVEVLRNTSKKVFVPITAGGAIRTVEDGRKLLAAGADKLAINSAAIRNPDLINELSERFGSQCVVISIQVCYSTESRWDVMIESGRERTKKNLNEWVIECQDRGAGEIFITSVDRDGTGNGPDINLISHVKDLVKIPLVIGGGFSSKDNIIEVYKDYRNLSGVAIGWALHNQRINIKETKEKLKELNFSVRDLSEKITLTNIKENIKASIINYGMGNTQSLINAFNHLGIDCKLTTDFETIDNTHFCVLPGVGAFPEGMRQLNHFNLLEKLRNFSSSGGRLIGICLGMQLLLSEGTEYKNCNGLNLIRGKVEKLPSFNINGKKSLIPHVGWNSLILNNQSSLKMPKDFENLYQYFVHSYALMTSKEIEKNIISTTNFEGHSFVSMIKNKNTIGMQFHPERSGKDGLNLLSFTLNSILD